MNRPSSGAQLTCHEHFDLFSHAFGMAAAATEASQKAPYEALGFARCARTDSDQLSGGTLASSTWAWRCRPTRMCCCWMSRTTASASTPTRSSGAWFAQRRAGRSVPIVSHFVVRRGPLRRIVAVRDGKAVPPYRGRTRWLERQVAYLLEAEFPAALHEYAAGCVRVG